MVNLNPYEPTPHPDDRKWFSGFPRWVKRAAVVVLVCIAVLVAVDAVWLLECERKITVGSSLDRAIHAALGPKGEDVIEEWMSRFREILP